MSNEGTRECLEQALSDVKLLERRMIGWHAAIINADRISLANNADSMRLDLISVYELLRDALGNLEPAVKELPENAAVFVKQLTDWGSDARVYRLSRPYQGYEYLVVSAADVPRTGPETFIFGSNNAEGRRINLIELDGSFRGGLDHAQALKNAGYQIVEG